MQTCERRSGVLYGAHSASQKTTMSNGSAGLAMGESWECCDVYHWYAFVAAQCWDAQLGVCPKLRVSAVAASLLRRDFSTLNMLPIMIPADPSQSLSSVGNGHYSQLVRWPLRLRSDASPAREQPSLKVRSQQSRDHFASMWQYFPISHVKKTRRTGFPATAKRYGRPTRDGHRRSSLAEKPECILRYHTIVLMVSRYHSCSRQLRRTHEARRTTSQSH